MILRDIKGQSMLVVMVLILATFLLCSAVLVMGTNAGKIAAFEVHQDQAYYIAEAGIEKVLAEAKNGPAWLRNLNTGSEYNFLANSLDGGKNYGAGTFEYIRVKKLAEDDQRATLAIECRGQCGSSIKNVKVQADLEHVYPENLFRGFWLSDAGSAGGNVFNLAADSFVSSDVVINSGSHITGDMYCRGLVCLQCADGGAIKINGDIYALGGVDFTGTGQLTINGFIFVDDINKAPDDLREITIVLPAGELAGKIPDTAAFPALLSAGKLAWYQKNAGYSQLPPVDSAVMAFQSGIYFISGDCALSGTYSGNALLVVDGSVTLGSLRRSSAADSLAILAAGAVSCAAGSGEIDALLYSAGLVNGSAGLAVRGSVLAAGLAGPGSRVNISFDQDLFNSYRDSSSWTTCFVRVTRWGE
ncbi:MAG: hypothetical protein PHF87_08330 [Desulfotomaculaceae bacterium]|nr:hypothetical protein [Desulfotomaculaceae bacterium]